MQLVLLLVLHPPQLGKELLVLLFETIDTLLEKRNLRLELCDSKLLVNILLLHTQSAVEVSICILICIAKYDYYHTLDEDSAKFLHEPDSWGRADHGIPVFPGKY